VLDHLRQVPAGVMRLIISRPDGSGLKSLADLAPFFSTSAEEMIARSGRPIGSAPTWDIATLAVTPAYRNAAATGLVALGLYQSVVRTSCRAGVEFLVAILDRVVYRMTRLKFAAPFSPLDAPRPYLGSASSYPVYCDLGEWRERLFAEDPAIGGIIYDGVGLGPALAPLDLRRADAIVDQIWPLRPSIAPVPTAEPEEPSPVVERPRLALYRPGE
jgi:hypothetical protein